MKKLVSLLLASCVGLSMATSVVKAEENVMQPDDYKVASDLSKAAKGFGLFQISGTIDLSKTINDKVQLAAITGQKDKYAGVLRASVEAADLFAGALDLYEREIKGKPEDSDRKWENLVMFSKGGEFPTAEYTFKLPDTAKVENSDSIKVSANTRTISSIKAVYDKADNTVKITVQLGNWNDYKGFFELVEQEKGQKGHLISVDIPFVIKGTADNLGAITGSGKCELFKATGFFKGAKIVDISAKPHAITFRIS